MADLNFELKTIEISKIERNPNNPRGDKFRANDEQFDYLKRSIKQFGLIVPLIVQKLEGGVERYRLVDGERRFLALRELGIRNAPANIIKDKISEEKAKNVMFHIHTNRVQWEAFQQCIALESVYENLKSKFGEDEVKIVQEILKLTGANRRTIDARLHFLRWPNRIKKIVYSKKPELYWTIVEIEGGIIVPAEKNFPKYFSKVSKDEIRELLLKKYLEGVAHASTEARRVKYIVRTTKDKIEQHKYAYKLFKKLVEEVDFTFEEAEEEFLSKFPEAGAGAGISFRKIFNQIVKLSTMLNEFNPAILKSISRKKKKEIKDALDYLESILSEFKKETDEYLGSN